MKRVLIAATVSLALASSALAAGGKPPPELLQLERETSLKLAHARDEGFTDPAKLLQREHKKSPTQLCSAGQEARPEAWGAINKRG